MVVPFSHMFFLSLALFLIGLVGIFTRRDAITVFLSVEILLNAANIAFVAFAQARGDEFGHIAAFIVIAVAAAEAAIGLAIVVRLKLVSETLDLMEMRKLRG